MIFGSILFQATKRPDRFSLNLQGQNYFIIDGYIPVLGVMETCQV